MYFLWKEIKKRQAKLAEIGKMLIRHIGLVTSQSGISKKGISWVHNLPPELAKYIATFTHSVEAEEEIASN